MKKIFLTKIRKGYNMKRLFCIFTAITVLFSLCIKAGATESGDTNKEDTETVNALLNKTFELYLLKYRGFSQSSEYVSLPPDKYHEMRRGGLRHVEDDCHAPNRNARFTI